MQDVSPAPVNLNSPVGLTSAALVFLALSLGLIVPKLAGGALMLLGLISIVWLSLHKGWRLGNMHGSEQIGRAHV
mgnify:CR=1 FL=1